MYVYVHVQCTVHVYVHVHCTVHVYVHVHCTVLVYVQCTVHVYVHVQCTVHMYVQCTVHEYVQCTAKVYVHVHCTVQVYVQCTVHVYVHENYPAGLTILFYSNWSPDIKREMNGHHLIRCTIKMWIYIKCRILYRVSQNIYENIRRWFCLKYFLYFSRLCYTSNYVCFF